MLADSNGVRVCARAHYDPLNPPTPYHLAGSPRAAGASCCCERDLVRSRDRQRETPPGARMLRLRRVVLHPCRSARYFAKTRGEDLRVAMEEQLSHAHTNA